MLVKSFSWMILGVWLASCGSDAATSSASGVNGSSAGAPATGRAGAAAQPTTAAGAAATGSAPRPAEAGARAPMPATPTGGTRGGAGASGASGAGSGGRGGTAAAGASAGGSSAGEGGRDATSNLERFSFFVTSLKGLQKLSGSQNGFGGDLRYGQPDGLSGADKICTELAESSMPGAGAKQWRAFLSVNAGPMGMPVHAIDRVGQGPWYDRLGRLLAQTRADLMAARPRGADPAIANDLPNESGVPNRAPDGMGEVNNHHFLTGSNQQGQVNGATSTCNDWTSTDRGAGRPRIGFSYPAGNRQHWISGQDEGGCGAGIVLVDNGPSDPSNPIVGSGGGYGGFYCFALTP